MTKENLITITIDKNDLDQILDALECRLEAYRKTTGYYSGENDGTDFIIEEVSNYDEAQQLADCCQQIMETLHKQINL